MRNPLLRTLVFAGPPALAFAVALPAASLWADRHFGLAWPLPSWASIPAIVLIPFGLALALHSVWLFAAVGEGTPNPQAPPLKLVARGPYRYSRNPMMLGGWIFGIGLALALQSPSLLAACLLIIAAGMVYVRRIEEPRLELRFGEAYRAYAKRVPRWLPVLILCLFLAVACLPAQTDAVPTLVIQIKFEPGGTRQWINDFETYIAPAIEEAIEKKDVITDYAYFENIVIGQPSDFMLILQAQSFSFFDERRPYPHYQALYRRVGVEQGRKIIAEMARWEKSVTVTLMRSPRRKK